MTRFRFSVTQLPAGGVYEFAGVIDETNTLASVEGADAQQPLLLDLSGIERINSYGVRDWVTWITRTEKAFPFLGLCEAPPAFVSQLAMVRQFAGNRGEVCSVLAPFVCERCSLEKTFRVPAANFRAPATTADRACPKCSGVLVFDDLPDSYFGFASDRSLSPQLVQLFDTWMQRKDANAAAESPRP